MLIVVDLILQDVKKHSVDSIYSQFVDEYMFESDDVFDNNPLTQRNAPKMLWSTAENTSFFQLG